MKKHENANALSSAHKELGDHLEDDDFCDVEL
jgi:hypothetical protein